MSRKIYLKDSRAKLLEGINLITDAVQSTLGPSGKTVIIANGEEEPFATKDGVTVAENVDSPDPVINASIQLFRKVATKMNTESGDGTTTVSVICRALIQLGLKLQEQNDFDEHRFKETIAKCLSRTIREVEEMSKEVTMDDVYKIAFTSSNNDEEIAGLFQKAFESSGVDGHINILESVNGKCYVDIISGYVLDMGYSERKYANNPITGYFEAKECYILLFDGEITGKRDIVKIIEYYDKKAKRLPLIIVAKEYSKEVNRVIDFNNIQRSGFDICLIKNQLRNQEYVDFLNDLSEYTGADITSEFSEFDYESGIGYGVVVKEGHTIFGKPSNSRQELLDKYVEQLIEQSIREESAGYSEQIKKRITKMTKGIITLYVGGDSDIEIKEKRHRVDDAYHACKASLESNCVIGGGQALSIIARTYLEHEFTDDYEKVFYNAIFQPAKQILINSHHTEGEILITLDNISKHNGYNAKTRRYVDLHEEGVIDPLKVVINSLKFATSIAMTILSTECLIVEVPHNNNN